MLCSSTEETKLMGKVNAYRGMTVIIPVYICKLFFEFVDEFLFFSFSIEDLA